MGWLIPVVVGAVASRVARLAGFGNQPGYLENRCTGVGVLGIPALVWLIPVVAALAQVELQGSRVSRSQPGRYLEDRRTGVGVPGIPALG